MNANIRRMEINLMTLGTGVILFAIWTFIRSALTLFLFNDDIRDLIPPHLSVWVYSFVFIITVIAFLFELYIGISARNEARGKRKSVLYLIFSVIGIASYFAVSVAEFIAIFSPGERGIIALITTFIIEITATVCLTEMLINSIRLRKIRKNLSLGEKGGAE